MHVLFKSIRFALSAAVVMMVTMTSAQTFAGDALPTEKQCKKNPPADTVTKGWCVAIDRRSGNCLACHAVVVDPWPEGLPPGGNIAPALVAMKHRFPDPAKLREQIWDATIANATSSMPPFGKHKLLSETQIDEIVEFLLSI